MSGYFRNEGRKGSIEKRKRAETFNQKEHLLEHKKYEINDPDCQFCKQERESSSTK